MGKLNFCCGVMGVGKTEALIEAVDILQEREVEYEVFSTMSEEVSSRNGMSLEAKKIESNLSNVSELLNYDRYLVIYIDEAQFLSKEQVQILRDIAYDLDGMICCFGLVTDYKGDFFEGSAELVKLSDNVEKLDRSCELCHNNGAIISMRRTPGKELIDLDKENYLAVCQKCYVVEEKGWLI